MQTITTITELGISPATKIVVWMPHPDDEAAFTSIFINQAVLLGCEIHVFTMTKGEASTKHYGLPSTDNLAHVRAIELQKALNLLGVNNNKLLDHPDGGLSSRINIISEQIKQYHAEIRPEVVITLEPDGIYGHPDHIALTEAVLSVTSPNEKILYTTVPTNTISSGSHLAQKEIDPIKPSYKLQFSENEKALKYKVLGTHSSQFDIDRLNIGGSEFFKRNQLLHSEYFTWKL